MQMTARRRHFWRFLAPVLALCVLAVTTAPARADAPVAPASDWPEVLTLNEAARFMQLDVGELERLARRQEVPARRVGNQWRFNRTALLAWLNGDWTLIPSAIPPSAMEQITDTGRVN